MRDPFEDLLVPRVDSPVDAGRRIKEAIARRRRRRVAIRVGMPIVLSCTAIAAVVAATRQPDRVTTTPSPPVSLPDGSSVRPAAVTARIEMPATIVSGGSVEAALVIDNNTSEELTITANGCGPKWALVLTNDGHPPASAFRDDCGPALVVPVGQSRLVQSVVASERECSAEPANDSSIPTCIDNRMPPLPPGDYQAVLVGLSSDPLPGVPLPEPVDVQILRPEAASSNPTTSVGGPPVTVHVDVDGIEVVPAESGQWGEVGRNAVAATETGAILVCGGQLLSDYSPNDQVVVRASTTRIWERRSPSDNCRGDAIGASQGQLVIVVVPGEPSSRVSRYDLKTDQWTVLTKVPGRVTSLVWGADPVVLVGSDAVSGAQALVAIDPASGAARPLDPVPDAIGFSRLVADGDRLGIVGLSSGQIVFAWMGNDGRWGPIESTGHPAYEFAATVDDGQLVIVTDGLRPPNEGDTSPGGWILRPGLRAPQPLPLRPWKAGFDNMAIAATNGIVVARFASGIVVADDRIVTVIPTSLVSAAVVTGDTVYLAGTISGSEVRRSSRLGPPVIEARSLQLGGSTASTEGLLIGPMTMGANTISVELYPPGGQCTVTVDISDPPPLLGSSPVQPKIDCNGDVTLETELRRSLFP